MICEGYNKAVIVKVVTICNIWSKSLAVTSHIPCLNPSHGLNLLTLLCYFIATHRSLF